MKILVVGGGGREHAIVRKLKANRAVEQIFCAPGNGGISADAACVDIKAADISAMVNFAVAEGIGFVVVAPDDPLVLGMVDALEAKGIRAFGPSKAAAQIEGSKVFSKDLMQRYGIPTAAYKSFDSQTEALAYVRERKSFPVVIKADGLALGKGVLIAETMEQAVQGIQSIMEDKIFGESGREIVIEQFLTGPEVSVLAFCDGKTVMPMVSSMDHKRVDDGNKGPNTGGMGAIAPNPHYTPAIANQCMEQIFLPTMNAMSAEGRPFKGCLYFGLMLTPDGPMVIEYNCRFGDPETQVVLELLETDLLTIMQASVDGTLDKLDIRWKDGAAACIALASGGYPGKYPTGVAVEGLDGSGQTEGATVYHAGTKRTAAGFATSGGRVLGVTATGDTLETALEKAYAAIKTIHFDGMHYRSDIGQY